MAQNFRRRITLLPNAFYNYQNSSEKFKEINLLEKADNDTLIKETINKVTPIKEKKINPLILDTPIIQKEQNKRRISIYSPLSFNEKSNIKNDNNEITNFNNGVSTDKNEEDFFSNFDLFSSGKSKKVMKSNKKREKEIEFCDGRNKIYKFGIYKDKNIFEEDKDNDIIIHNDKVGKYLNNNNDNESSDEEKIENDYKKCMNILNDGIEFYSNSKNCISRNINNNN